VTPEGHRDRAGAIIGGKYRIVRLLAQGGMSVVYEAQHLVVKRRFALKFLRPDLSQQRESLARFQREAEVAGALECENVAAVLDFGITEDGAPFIVMEYLVGENLASLLARSQTPPPESFPYQRAVDLCIQACRGVQAAHAVGIVHRDLKPQNLFVCRREDGTDLLKVLDFGIAKLTILDGQGAITSTGDRLGTPFYMPPEQARGERNVDHRADIYGLGAVLYELLSARKPHPGDSANALVYHIATQPAVPLAMVADGLPSQLTEIVDRCLSSNPGDRFASAQSLAEALFPFARRQVWPEVPAPILPTASAESFQAAARRPALGRRTWRTLALVAALSALPVFGLGTLLARRGALPSPVVGRKSLPPATQFFVPRQQPAAIQQIADLGKRRGLPREVGLLTSMVATPQGLWFSGGTPDEVRDKVRNTMVRAVREQRVPILVTYNLPYRDCAGYGAGGAENGAAYKTWIDAFASGIGHEKAIVILEPDSLGIIPYNTTLAGVAEWCRPTAAEARGQIIPAPGATAAERYAQLAYAIDTLAAKAPYALVYLDGTHSAWLPVGEMAFRLVRAGVHKVQGLAVNVSNFQRTQESVRYGTWISKCIYYANNPTHGRLTVDQYTACVGPPSPADPHDESAWSATEQWYVDNVDRAANPPAGPSVLAHVVVDTGRNARGILDTEVYASAPYSQPKEILRKLATGNWCNPPNAGLGLRPTANTGQPLVDAFLWVKTPGESDGSCDIAGGARAWDYSKHNPWAITGDAQNHFDPLWGMVDPAPGEWFPEQALQLVQNADPLPERP
jgi:endoglucanase